MIKKAIEEKLIKLGGWAYANKTKIFGGLGIGCEALSIVSAGVGTHYAEKQIAECRETMDNLKKQIESGDISKDDAKKEVFKLGAKVSVAVGLCYAPTVGLFVMSLVFRNKQVSALESSCAALVADYAALESAFEAYRGRVKERYGEEAEHDLSMGLETKKNEDGTVTKVSKMTEEEAAKEFIFYFASDQTVEYDRPSHLTRIYIQDCVRAVGEVDMKKFGVAFPFDLLTRRLGFSADKLPSDIHRYCWYDSKVDPSGCCPCCDIEVVNRLNTITGEYEDCFAIKLLNLRPVEEAQMYGAFKA